MFLGIFKANSMFLPPWKILPSPGKKSADAHAFFLSLFLSNRVKCHNANESILFVFRICNCSPQLPRVNYSRMCSTSWIPGHVAVRNLAERSLGRRRQHHKMYRSDALLRQTSGSSGRLHGRMEPDLGHAKHTRHNLGVQMSFKM
jgi:hypothetical protein